ncbi:MULTISPECIES: VRR-NUC domain-containing protein [Halomonadaceae]|uniref:VRR-NUC domain-containing protein n=1 Tax=Halomonadaceae TaxID=28256 RepID=UPI0015984BFD|nr:MULTISPECIES: VRR-NUC domain-containing protein [Halomonas]QJQ94547.1 VRR-NUC domain-containing protein [Halomonas sp. PA5]
MNSISAASPVTASLDDPLYYLKNFRFVLAWVAERYGDLLSECHVVATFNELPEPAQALLVRMIMRKGSQFRTAKLSYVEIGDTDTALAPLFAQGWVEEDPSLDLDTLFRLLTKAEINRALGDAIADAGLSASSAKAVLLDTLRPLLNEPRSFSRWWPQAPDQVVALTSAATSDRLRLMFFGNLRQDWAEFVLTELGLQRFERVEFNVESRAFQHREEVDAYLHLHRLRERFEAAEPLEAVWQDVPPPSDNTWLASRRAKLLFQLAREAERRDESDMALEIYRGCTYPEARVREVRVLERHGNYRQALMLAEQALAASCGEAEMQHLLRIVPRLHRRLGLPACKLMEATGVETERLDLALPRPLAGGVEAAVCEHLGNAQAPVRYVENTLIGGLFGLLCWRAIFAPLPGAFFHPFQAAPADLYREDFVTRRGEIFATCLAELDDGRYRQTIRDTYRAKHGLASSFVHWGVLDESLLEHTLACLPAAHLKSLFSRLLDDLKANRAGLPDLIQLWPARTEGQRYRLIEVKGPGDRLQDNQRRWLAYFQEHGIPVTVCHVRWQEASSVGPTT